MTSEFLLRAVHDSDAEALAALVEGCFQEYQGVFLDLDHLDADLKAYGSYMKDVGGEARVHEVDGIIAAFVSGMPIDNDRYQLKRLYVASSMRGTGIASYLLRQVEERALKLGAKQIELWSDSRFSRAHSFYVREGFVKQDKTQELNDISNTTEYFFIKTL